MLAAPYNPTRTTRPTGRAANPGRGNPTQSRSRVHQPQVCGWDMDIAGRDPPSPSHIDQAGLPRPAPRVGPTQTRLGIGETVNGRKPNTINEKVKRVLTLTEDQIL